MNKEKLLDKEIEFLQLQLQLYPGKHTRNQNVARGLRARLNQLHQIKQSKRYQAYEPTSAAYAANPAPARAEITQERIAAVASAKTTPVPTATPVQYAQSPIAAVATSKSHGFALTMKIALGIYLGFLLCLVTYIVLFNAGMFPTTP